jgi:IS5 family transposase
MTLKRKDTQMAIFVPNVEDFVSQDHAYRKLNALIDFPTLTKGLKKCYSTKGRAGYPVSTAFKCLLLQFMEDLSDRELERFLQENLAGKYFCDFKLDDQTPDFSYFSTLRKRIGTKNLADMFNQVRAQLKKKNIIKEVFSFVDATHLVSKVSTWNERDKAIKEGMEKLNNATIGKVAVDKQARFGCKNKNKFWFGYKAHVSVDMTNGIINKIAVTPANVPDQNGVKHVCPDGGMIFGDKAYCLKSAQIAMKRKGCYSGAIKKNNMKGKDFRHDKWLSQIRSPFEGIFSQFQKRVRYRGLAKVQFQEYMEAFRHNLKRLIKIDCPRLEFEIT